MMRYSACVYASTARKSLCRAKTHSFIDNLEIYSFVIAKQDRNLGEKLQIQEHSSWKEEHYVDRLVSE